MLKRISEAYKQAMLNKDDNRKRVINTLRAEIKNKEIELRTSNKFYLDSLPEKLKYTVNGVNLCFTHGSPNLINEYLFEDAENTKKVMENFEDDVLICAHTHIPFVKKVNDKLIVNVGSIGKPKIGRPNITYAILNIDDAGNVDVTIRELEYEYRRIMKDCIMLNFPSAIVNSYETGQE